MGHLDSKNHCILGEEKSHVAGEIEGRCEPEPSRHIELPASSRPKLRNRLHGALKRRGVQRLPIPDPSEIRQIERHGSQPRQRARHRYPPPEERDPVNGAHLPSEHQTEPHDPERQNQRPVHRKEPHQPSGVLMERRSPPGGGDLHHDLAQKEALGIDRICHLSPRTEMKPGSIGGPPVEELDQGGARRSGGQCDWKRWGFVQGGKASGN